MDKLNCWEFKKCGREPGGAQTAEYGVCPAATEARAEGANGGHNGGRACWAIVGTLCKGVVQDTIAAKLHQCVGCDFRHAVEAEEGADLRSPAMIAKMIG